MNSITIFYITSKSNTKHLKNRNWISTVRTCQIFLCKRRRILTSQHALHQTRSRNGRCRVPRYEWWRYWCTARASQPMARAPVLLPRGRRTKSFIALLHIALGLADAACWCFMGAVVFSRYAHAFAERKNMMKGFVIYLPRRSYAYFESRVIFFFFFIGENSWFLACIFFSVCFVCGGGGGDGGGVVCACSCTRVCGCGCVGVKCAKAFKQKKDLNRTAEVICIHTRYKWVMRLSKQDAWSVNLARLNFNGEFHGHKIYR